MDPKSNKALKKEGESAPQLPADTGASPPPAAGPSSGPPQPTDSILGLSTGDLQSISVEQLQKNPTAITMLLHHYRKFQEENVGLKNEVNTLHTYVDAYKTKKLNASIGGPMLVVSNLICSFGLNMLTGGLNPMNPVSIWAGISLLVPGLAMTGFGVYLTMIKDNQ